jgi:hypothetical protein
LRNLNFAPSNPCNCKSWKNEKYGLIFHQQFNLRFCGVGNVGKIFFSSPSSWSVCCNTDVSSSLFFWMDFLSQRKF